MVTLAEVAHPPQLLPQLVVLLEPLEVYNRLPPVVLLDLALPLRQLSRVLYAPLYPLFHLALVLKKQVQLVLRVVLGQSLLQRVQPRFCLDDH